jgi:hypothetical protein
MEPRGRVMDHRREATGAIRRSADRAPRVCASHSVTVACLPPNLRKRTTAVCCARLKPISGGGRVLMQPTNVIELHDGDGTVQHAAFQALREKYPDGVFLTLTGKGRANLHGARCFHLGSADWTIDAVGHSLTRERKILADSERDLVRWANEQDIQLHDCKHCLRDSFISGTHATESHDPFQYVPESRRLRVALLAAEVIEHAASFGDSHWGLTSYRDAFRVNVGWTEILTANRDSIRLVVDGKLARGAGPLEGVSVEEGEDIRGIYPTVPGSVLAVISYMPKSFEENIEALRPALMESIRLAARRRAGRGVKAGHEQAVVDALATLVGRHLPTPSYAQNETSTSDKTSDGRQQTPEEHFVAYHSVRKMGYDYGTPGSLAFLSKKGLLLKKAIGNIVWVIQGDTDGRKTAYALTGAYVADSVALESKGSDAYVIRGSQGVDFVPPIPLNELGWFPAFLKFQSNFSLGFNRITNESVVRALLALRSENNAHPSDSPLPDVDFAANEGAPYLVAHLRRERDRGIVAKKKAEVRRSTGRLACEACGFDFFVAYGAHGEDFCEVHHLSPLSLSDESVTTTLVDLAVLCSNCHRIIHRSNPLLSIAELSAVVQNVRKSRP